MLCRLLLVTMTVAVVLVPTATEPRFSALGDVLTPACAASGKTTEATASNPTKRHTKRVLFMTQASFVDF